MKEWSTQQKKDFAKRAINRAGGKQAWRVYSRDHQEGFVAAEVMQVIMMQHCFDKDASFRIDDLKDLYRGVLKYAGVAEEGEA